MSDGPASQPTTAIYDETENWFRQNSMENFQFLPVGLNAFKQGRLSCFRRVTDLAKEAAGAGKNAGQPHDWAHVMWLDRKCPKWSQYEPGIAPRDHLAEERSRHFALQLRSIEGRLTLAAIIFGVIIGIAQIIAAALAVTPDAMGCQLVKDVGGFFGLLHWLHCR